MTHVGAACCGIILAVSAVVGKELLEAMGMNLDATPERGRAGSRWSAGLSAPVLVTEGWWCQTAGMTDSDITDRDATTGGASVSVPAAPAAVFAYLTDLALLPGLSPENQRCEFLEGWSQIEVGARFRGYNKAGDYEWHADCEVTVYEPDREFAYVVPPNFEAATSWTYTITPDADGDGCTVTESFHAPLLTMPEVYPGTIEGRRDNLERACEITMANLRAAFAD